MCFLGLYWTNYCTLKASENYKLLPSPLDVSYFTFIKAEFLDTVLVAGYQAGESDMLMWHAVTWHLI